LHPHIKQVIPDITLNINEIKSVNLRVIKSGAFDTIQDSGRYGFQYLGINPGGAMDLLAMQVANMLVGNDINDGVIELHYPASSFLFQQDGIIALSGADFSATLNDLPLPVNTPVVVSQYSFLQFTKYNSGARCYLAIHGGFDIPQWLNSYSTNVKAKAGGYHGRCLKKDDELPVRKSEAYIEILRTKDCITLLWKADISQLYATQNAIRICTGGEYDHLTDSSKGQLTASRFIITDQSDRMGYRMRGESLRLQQHPGLISSAVTEGTIQVMPDGQLIILMADHQTTGGYPRVGYVISADMPTLAQLRPNTPVQFQVIDHSEAEELCWRQYQYLQVLENACKLRLKEFLETL
jgi:antagonist of KipI